MCSSERSVIATNINYDEFYGVMIIFKRICPRFAVDYWLVWFALPYTVCVWWNTQFSLDVGAIIYNIYLLIYLLMKDVSQHSALRTSLALDPETSIHVLEKKAQEPSMKMMYSTAWIGSSSTCWKVSGGDR